MAIRGPPPNPHDVQQPPRLHRQASSPLKRLLDFGSARTPQEARKLFAELLAGLRAAGFPVPKTASTDADLSQALKQFQREHGLDETGVLDKPTHDALADAGLLPKDGAASADAARTSAPPESPARFDVGLRGKPGPGFGELGLPRAGDGAVPEGAKSAQAVELEQLVDKSARDRPPEVDLKGFLASLRAAGFPGAGKGAEQLKDALRKVQRAEGLPSTGQLDKKTADALVRRGIVDERALPLAAATDASHDPTTRGAQQGSPEATVGKDGGERAAAGGDRSAPNEISTPAGPRPENPAHPPGAGTPPPAQAEGPGTGDVEDPWSAGHDGNAPAGDEDVDDDRRGHANVVDPERDHAAGHWEVASLAEQIEAGLAAIVRDDGGTGAATYAWDFTLFRPGVYGAKQPAEKLFHLVVAKAGPFDAVWSQARAALNGKLRALEPGSPLVDAEDFARALRVARVR